MISKASGDVRPVFRRHQKAVQPLEFNGRRVVLVGDKMVAVENSIQFYFGRDDCVVKISVATVCSLDARAYSGESTRLLLGKPPVLGHECFGHVVHPGNSGLALGTAVGVIGTFFCGSCRACQHEQPLYCSALGIVGGAFADFVVIPSNWCRWRLVPLAAHTDPVVASNVDTISCAVRALRLGRLTPGQDVLIVGGGFVGLTLGLVAQLLGARPIVVADSALSRVALARNSITHASTAEIAETRRNANTVGLAVVVNEKPRLGELLVRAVAPGGCIVVMTSKLKSPAISLAEIYLRRLSVLSSIHSDMEDRERAAAMLPSLSKAIREISKPYMLGSVNQALSDLVGRKVMRCHLNCE